MITADSREVLTDSVWTSANIRASNLVSIILNKIELDSRYFEKFIDVLTDGGERYRDVLGEINSYRNEDHCLSNDSMSQAQSSESTVSEDRPFDLSVRQSDLGSETSTLIRLNRALRQI